MTLDYKTYIQKKYDWTTGDCYKVYWNAIKLSMHHFKNKDRQAIQKVFHDCFPYRLPPIKDLYQTNKHFADPVSNMP